MPFDAATGRHRCPGCDGLFEILPIEEIKADPDRYAAIFSDKHEIIHAGCPGSDREDRNTHEAHDHKAVAQYLQSAHGVKVGKPAKVDAASDGEDAGQDG